MQRSDYAFAPLTWEQYQAIIGAGSFPNVPEPMLNHADYDSLIAVMQPANIDPRLPLAFTWAEGHDGTDTGLVAAAVNNLGGIKFSDAPGTYDSKIPADTGGTYAGFPDLSLYWREWVRVMNNSIIGPSFNSGDLAGAVGHYTNGPGTGTNKVDKFLEYTAAYPPQGGTVSATPQVYGEEIIAKARQYIGQANSDGTLDTINGVHPWAYFCEAFAESVPRALGLPQVARPTALDKGNAMQAQGLFRNGPPQHGDWMIFGARFFAQGHIAFFDAEKGMALGTLTDGTGIGYANYGPNSPGYMGCAPVPGVVAPYRTAPAPAPTVTPPNNPYNHAITDPTKLIGVGGGFKTLFEATPNPLAVYGWPMANEVDAFVMEPDGTKNGRTVQFFERAIMVYTPKMPSPWDVTLALRSQTVVPR